MREHCLSLVCDDDVCTKAEEKLESNGIDIYRNTKVTEIVGDDEVEAVKFADGREISADTVILATGVVPNLELAEDAGIDYDEQKGILVDKFMRTSDQDIFACGDCTEKPSFFGDDFDAARLASIATTEGRMIGANLYELRREKQESVGIFATIVDDLAIGVAGLTEKQADDVGMKVVTGEAEAVNRHPGKMPGAAKLGVKLIFKEYSGVIIGAQAYGGDSTGEFINILGLAIEKEMTAEELATLQIGTHPALTASPIAYQIINAAEDAVAKL